VDKGKVLTVGTHGMTCDGLEQARGDHTPESEAGRSCWHLNAPSIPGTSFQGLWGSVAQCKLQSIQGRFHPLPGSGGPCTEGWGWGSVCDSRPFPFSEVGCALAPREGHLTNKDCEP